jgi:glycosyltransferase involved in cell wall biosynthesis
VRRPVVAIVTDAIFPFHRGGKETRYHELARRLGARAEVHVYTMKWWEGDRVLRRDGITFVAIAPRLALYSGERRSMRQALVFAAACLRLAGRRFDVIEADHMPYLQLFPLRLVATLRRVPLVVTWHESWGPAYWREYLGQAGRVGWWLERAAMRLPDAIIAASPHTAARLRERLGAETRITVAPNGIDLDEVDGATPAAARADLVVVGRLLDHKRVDLLVDTVALLRERGRPVSCRVIGDGPERDALSERARRLGVDDLVEFRHDVAGRRELYSHLKSARAFVFPSAREGFGIAVLEALACGLPVVTTSAPDNLARHLIDREEHGVVCEPTAPALADAVAAVLDGRPVPAPGEARNGDGSEAWLREYDWGAVTDRVAEVVLR